jgi:hypothetical protein
VPCRERDRFARSGAEPVADAVRTYHRDYVWHQFAEIWQTPQEGEAFFENYNALSFEEQVAMLTATGIPEKFAPEVARSADTTMQQCILDLYRSSTEFHHDWGTDLRPTPRRDCCFSRAMAYSATSLCSKTSRRRWARRRKRWTGWITGGCCKIPNSQRPCSNGSGQRSDESRSLASGSSCLPKRCARGWVSSRTEPMTLGAWRLFVR